METTSARPGPLARLGVLLEMIKFQHTVFALPFALMAALAASGGRLEGRVLFWILVAMVGARTSAMTFNRIVDRGLDALNPRTAGRALPAGLVSVGEAWFFLAAATGLFVIAAWRLNLLAFALSPVALAVVWGYSYTKRFTKWSHAVLGLALAIAPVGAWIAVTGHIAPAVLWLAAGVLAWVAGFDIIYSLSDIDFDRQHGLHSMPSRWGPQRALMVSGAMHVFCAVAFALFGWFAGLGAAYFAGVALALAGLAYEHNIVSPGDFSRVDAAFFNVNGYISIGLLTATVISVYVETL